MRLRPEAVAGPVNWSTANESRSRLNHPAEDSRVLIDDWADVDRPPIGDDVELEVHPPHPIRVHPRLRSVVRCCRGLLPRRLALEALLRAKGIAFSRD